MKILVINGPNINMLGVREPEIYGKETYINLVEKIEKYAKDNWVEVKCFQSNHEGDIIDKLHEKGFSTNGIILNAGAYTHTSLAIADAISAINSPVIEVHISNINARDEFRKTSVIGPVCRASIAGFGRYSYILGMDGLIRLLSEE